MVKGCIQYILNSEYVANDVEILHEFHTITQNCFQREQIALHLSSFLFTFAKTYRALRHHSSLYILRKIKSFYVYLRIWMHSKVGLRLLKRQKTNLKYIVTRKFTYSLP